MRNTTNIVTIGGRRNDYNIQVFKEKEGIIINRAFASKQLTLSLKEAEELKLALTKFLAN